MCAWFWPRDRPTRRRHFPMAGCSSNRTISTTSSPTFAGLWGGPEPQLNFVIHTICDANRQYCLLPNHFWAQSLNRVERRRRINPPYIGQSVGLPPLLLFPGQVSCPISRPSPAPSLAGQDILSPENPVP